MFSPVNTAIYAISMEQEMDDGDSTYDSSFKTVDAIDYSSIGKKNTNLTLVFYVKFFKIKIELQLTKYYFLFCIIDRNELGVFGWFPID